MTISAQSGVPVLPQEIGVDGPVAMDSGAAPVAPAAVVLIGVAIVPVVMVGVMVGVTVAPAMGVSIGMVAPAMVAAGVAMTVAAGVSTGAAGVSVPVEA